MSKWQESTKHQWQIATIKSAFTNLLCNKLDLSVIPVPMVIPLDGGFNDHLSGSDADSPLVFGQARKYQVSQSSAKMKRYYLTEMEAPEGKGMVAHMTAIRPGEEEDATHAKEVDQFDWERVISSKDRTTETLVQHANAVYECIVKTASSLAFVSVTPPSQLKFFTSAELEEQFGSGVECKEPRKRQSLLENKAAEIHGAICVMSLGHEQGRAPDYDDWTLNADIIVWHCPKGQPIKGALELSSMGIRVDRAALARQLDVAGVAPSKFSLYHEMIFQGKFKQTIGGGVGESRLAMYLMGASHIEQVRPMMTPTSNSVSLFEMDDIDGKGAQKERVSDEAKAKIRAFYDKVATPNQSDYFNCDERWDAAAKMLGIAL